jgi:hypothetical protein
LSIEPEMRGRVLTAVFAIAQSGAPIVASVADWCGPRWALGVGALAGVVAAAWRRGTLSAAVARLRTARPRALKAMCRSLPPTDAGVITRRMRLPGSQSQCGICCLP